MHFLTVAEAREWCRDRVELTDAGVPTPPSREQRFARGPTSDDVAFCRLLERALQPRDACLLWVTDWGIWRSSENLHLYYHLRQSYGDRRQLAEAPAHLFLDYEGADLVSYLQVGLLCGWDMHLLPAVGYARAFVSHDEYFEFTADNANGSLVDEFAAALEGAQVMSREAPA
jgi:hypothetical protein